LKTTQNRIVYTSSIRKVTISIDTDIDFNKDSVESNKYPSYSAPASSNIHRFPYCVVPIAMGEDETPSDIC
jgi:hypothetical protein